MSLGEALVRKPKGLQGGHRGHEGMSEFTPFEVALGLLPVFGTTVKATAGGH